MEKLVAFIAALVVCMSAYSQTPPTPQPVAGQQQPSTQQRGTEKEPLFVKGEITTKKDKAEADKEAKESEEKRTLEQTTVKFAGWALVVAAIAFIAAAVQVGLFFWQLRLMRKGVDDAAEVAESAKASAETAKASIDSYKISERAWVSCVSVSNHKFTDATIGNSGKTMNGVMFLLHWTNAGRTPAIKTILGSSYNAVDFGSHIPRFTPPSKTDNAPERHSTLVPGANASSPPAVFSDAEIEALTERKRRLFIYGHVWYEDIFSKDQTRHTEVCMEVEYAGLGLDPKGNKTTLFNFSAIGSQNTAS